MSARYTLSGDLWASFREEHWGRKPAVLRRPFPQPFITAAELFEGLRHASDLLRSGDAAVPLQVVAEDETALEGADLAEHLPHARDASVEAYVERVTQRLDGRRFALLINGYQRYDPAFWQRM